MDEEARKTLAAFLGWLEDRRGLFLCAGRYGGEWGQTGADNDELAREFLQERLREQELLKNYANRTAGN